MNVRQGAWHIAKHELYRDRNGIWFTLIFCLYLSLTTLGVYGTFNGGDYSWVLDLIFVATFPSFGFLMNRTTFHFMREDTYTGKLAEWRTMPIPLSQLVLGRLLQLTIVLVPILIVFFSLHYLFATGLKEMVSLIVFVQFALFWLFYALTIALIYVYWELGYSGKAYSYFCYVSTLLFILIIIGVNLAGGHLVLGLLEKLQAGHWWYTAIAFVVCAASVLIAHRFIVRRLEQRNFIRKQSGAVV